jgi:predicted site-specific integrase-resolvase
MTQTQLTAAQVAERLDVSPATVRLWCSQGRFKAARLVEHPRGDYWEIPESEVETFIPPKAGRPPKPKAETAKKGANKKGGKK